MFQTATQSGAPSRPPHQGTSFVGGDAGRTGCRCTRQPIASAVAVGQLGHTANSVREPIHAATYAAGFGNQRAVRRQASCRAKLARPGHAVTVSSRWQQRCLAGDLGRPVPGDQAVSGSDGRSWAASPCPSERQWHFGRRRARPSSLSLTPSTAPSPTHPAARAASVARSPTGSFVAHTEPVWVSCDNTHSCFANAVCEHTSWIASPAASSAWSPHEEVT